MSLSASLNNALAGLSLSSRRAEIIASNVANADTPGYARRRLTTGGPVTGVPTGQISVGRQVDPAMQSLRREAEARSADASVGQAFHADLDAALGDPDQAGSLQELLSRFDVALTSAASDPTSEVRLRDISQTAHDLTAKLNALGEQVTLGRQATEGKIADTVDQLNRDLSSVQRLNADIARMQATGGDPSNLLDQRQQAVDRISVAVPIRELPRENGVIALVSQGGVILLDGKPAEIAFEERQLIQPEMTFPDTLSGITVRGRDIGTGTTRDGLSGGELAALFELRDETAPTALARLDAFAAELATRFQSASVDPSLGGTLPGLFVDGTGRFDLSDITGLSSRISVNPLVGVGQDADLWRLRDGLGAAAEGPVSSSEQLLRFGDAMRTISAPVETVLGGAPTDLSGLAASLKSSVSLDRVTSQDRLGRLQAQAQSLGDLRDGGKVDVDEEMRRLLEVEQAYAANARLVQAVGQMMDRLTEI